MSKAVLISIRPEWVEKILSGEKILEVRKNRPNMETPFKVYIYCTAGNLSYKVKVNGGMVCNVSGGKIVVGEFVCDTYVTDKTFGHDALFNAAACMSEPDVVAYSAGTTLYGWHISKLEIYDTPKELTEFHTLKKCKSCSKSGYESTACTYDENCIVPAVITKAPQSWCYVEELNNG